ncbi:MAG TPA: hypothetical protein PL009_01405 [Flavipsychrobacter sp.]|nr:hypothetical protein [Flavipsychrobacter sp.]
MSATDNLSTVQISAENESALETIIGNLATWCTERGLVSLSPEERKDYGKVAMERVGFVEMVYEDVLAVAALQPAGLDMDAWTIDEDTAQRLHSLYTSLMSHVQRIEDALMLNGFDRFTAANRCYRYARYLAKEGDAEGMEFYAKWKAQYSNSTPDES